MAWMIWQRDMGSRGRGKRAGRAVPLLVTQACGDHRAGVVVRRKCQHITKCHVSSSTSETWRPPSGSWRYFLQGLSTPKIWIHHRSFSTANCSVNPQRPTPGGSCRGHCARSPACQGPISLQEPEGRWEPRTETLRAITASSRLGKPLVPPARLSSRSPPQASAPGGRIRVQWRWCPMKTSSQKAKRDCAGAGPPGPAQDPSPPPVSRSSHLEKNCTVILFFP